MMMMEVEEKEVEETSAELGFHTIMDIPIHVLFDIMLKLPAVSLVRCYSVCSKFKSIVSDSSFQQSYFSKASISFVVLSNHNHLTCFDSSQTLNPIISSDHGSSSCMAMQLQPSTSSDSKRTKSITTNTPILHHHHHHQSSRFVSFHIHKRMNLINSSNGLLCLRASSNHHSHSLYYICNPLLGEVLNVPPAPSASDQYLHFSAFGFDPKTKTFKILQLVSKSNKLVAELYQSDSGDSTWSVIPNSPSAKPKPNSSFDPSLNDALHWVTDGTISELIYSFNLNTNKFKSIPCPMHFVDEYVSKISGMSVGVLKGCLCLCYVVEGARFETWLMEKYGVKESWRKAFSIDIKSYCGWSPQDKHRPIGFNSCGDMWLRADSDSQSSSQCLVSFSPETGVFRHIDIGDAASNIQATPQVHEFKTDTGVCSAFLANYDTKYAATVKYGDEQYELPPWSVSILPNCKTAVFNTARRDTQSSLMKITAANRAFSWHSYNKEPASSNERGSIIAYALWEQINVTRDSTDSLWYMTDVNIDPNEGFLRNGQSPLLTIMSAGHAMHVFINGQFSGSVYGSLEFPKLTFSQNVKLRVGNNMISLLGMTVGLPVLKDGLLNGAAVLGVPVKATIKETKTRNKQKRRELLSHPQEIGDEASGGGLLSRILIACVHISCFKVTTPPHDLLLAERILNFINSGESS